MLTFVNPFSVGSGTRPWLTIRGVGTVPEADLLGYVTTENIGNGFVGNGGLIFSNTNTVFTGGQPTIYGGAVYVGGNDLLTTNSGALGGSSITTVTLGGVGTYPTTTQNIGFMTYGSGAGIGASPIITECTISL